MKQSPTWGRYHDLMDSSYFLQDGSMRQLRLLITRLPVVPEFPLFRDRYTPISWQKRWNWLNPTFRTLKCHIENFIQIVKTIAGSELQANLFV